MTSRVENKKEGSLSMTEPCCAHGSFGLDRNYVRDMPTSVRVETARDIQAIRETVQAAFATKSHLDHQESRIVDQLRESRDLTVSLVADKQKTVIGHIAISPVRVEGEGQDIEGWYGLGPLAVHPECQRQGVGSELVEEALKALREKQAKGCVVLGRPEYYTRFGFSRGHSLQVDGVPKRFAMVLPIVGVVPSGTVVYHEAFNV